MFETRYPVLKGNVQYPAGRPTRIQKTSRPGHVRKGVWDCIGESAKQALRSEWKQIGPQREETREARGLPEKIPLDQVAAYEKIVSDTR